MKLRAAAVLVALALVACSEGQDPIVGQSIATEPEAVEPTAAATVEASPATTSKPVEEGLEPVAEAAPQPEVSAGTVESSMAADQPPIGPLPTMEFPDDVALLTREHPYTYIGRDGLKSSELLRIVKRPGEGVVREVLFSNTVAKQLGVEGGVLIYAVAPDVSTIVANICLEGSCVDPYGSGPLDGRTVFYQSRDGGVTWQPLASFDYAWVIEQLLPSDGDETRLLLRDERSRSATPDNLDYMMWPSGESVTPPEPPEGHRVLGTVLLSDGRVAWGMDTFNLSFPIFLTGNGEDVTELVVKQLTPECPSCSMAQRWASLGRFYYYAGGHVALEISDGLYILGWGSVGPSARPKYSLEQLQGGATTSTAETGDDIYWPTIRDSNTMEEWPIRLPEHVLKLGDMLLPTAVQQGPFLRVVGMGEDCLPLRADPSPQAEELDCMAERVLLQDQGGDVIADDGVTWQRVKTPAGIEGWADGRYLER